MLLSLCLKACYNAFSDRDMHCKYALRVRILMFICVYIMPLAMGDAILLYFMVSISALVCPFVV